MDSQMDIAMVLPLLPHALLPQRSRLLRFCLEKGVNPNHALPDEHCLLDRAIQAKSWDAVDLLLDSGACVDGLPSAWDELAPFATPLMLSLRIDVTYRLLSSNCNPNKGYYTQSIDKIEPPNLYPLGHAILSRDIPKAVLIWSFGGSLYTNGSFNTPQLMNAFHSQLFISELCRLQPTGYGPLQLQALCLRQFIRLLKLDEVPSYVYSPLISDLDEIYSSLLAIAK